MIRRALLVLEQLAEELADFGFCRSEDASAGRRGSVEPANTTAVSVRGGLQITLGLEAVQDGIQRARAETIAVPGQLFDHPQAEDLTLPGVVEDVQANESGIEVAVVRGHRQVEGLGQPMVGWFALL